MSASLYQTLFDKQILDRDSENVKICDNFFTAHFLTTWRKFIQGYFFKYTCSLYTFRYTRRIFIREEKMEKEKKQEETKATLAKMIAKKKGLSTSEQTSLERTSKDMLVKILAWVS